MVVRHPLPADAQSRLQPALYPFRCRRAALALGSPLKMPRS